VSVHHKLQTAADAYEIYYGDDYHYDKNQDGSVGDILSNGAMQRARPFLEYVVYLVIYFLM